MQDSTTQQQQLSIKSQLLSLAYSNLPPMVGVNVAASIGAVWIFLNNSVTWAWSFLIAVLLINGIRMLVWLRYKFIQRNNSILSMHAINFWQNAYAIGLYSAAAIWAVTVCLCVNGEALDVQFPIIVIISALSGGATGVTAPLKVEGRIYLAILLLPMSVTMALVTPPEVVLSSLGFLFLVVMLLIHNNNHKIVRESITLRIENTALINDLKDINTSLEDKVSDRTQELKLIANRDTLTEIANRRGLMEWMTEHLNAKITDDAAILFLDLDRFKQINDAKGHEVGDQVLKMVAMRFKDSLTEDTMLARWGGDEFIIATVQQPGAQHIAQEQAKQLIEAISVPFDIDGEQLGLGLSIGIAYYPSDANTFKKVIHAADLAAAEVKRIGRGQALSFNENYAEIQRYRFDISRALAHAIKAGSLSLVYQPIIHAATGHITSFEALARWTHPTIGPINPTDFVKVAEETDRIVALGDWVLQKACSDAAKWVQSEHAPSAPKVAVNVSVKQLLPEDFSTRVAQILNDTGLPATRLALEVTESLFDDEHMDIVLETVKDLKEMGIEIHIDDFGTGYSSLSRLHQFPVTSIKIDRSFILQIQNQGHVIIESAILIARNFNLKVIAEGVETQEQARELYAMGVDFFQGYYFSKPTSDAELKEYTPDWQEYG